VKTTTKISVSLFFAFLLTLSTCVNAQDIVKVIPNNPPKVLLENDEVRVLQIESAPGDITPMHSHPNYILYALTDGKLEVTDKGKSPSVLTFKAGDALYLPAVTHMVKNIGSTPVKMVLTELKTAEKR
jgi:quercetin dioxygenase-like cupin family protein